MDKKKKERASQKALAKKLKEVEVAARKKAIKNAGSLKGIQTKSSSSLFDLSKKEKPGKNNWRKFGFDLHPQVTFFSVIILTICIVLTLLFSSTAENVFSTLLNEITETTGWIMIFAVNILLPLLSILPLVNMVRLY
ncbi:hypothetical protein [Amphibacillus sediminis]|uniref:hypothetical protein n=1 Tax=Amphibacillus sediminis TaxID=360185 RepID=UPI001C3F1A0B|nr:hypothetical protein [Amphibacillus sediminis]